ncbi:hypothetical protein CALCODRAFT_497639 [Calocera cornea HHB12733]|uniref:SNF2 family DNA-dependent ATPase domain-containing protein n=1 Tax=Calocera cornea HHB12733 TaxID=1353952 RepID=A0A165F520_9BASI|nr:hypothetical protein CALCODRAFT_497639 [Calocera cornea HHB12733]
MAAAGVANIEGFGRLKTEDQQKVRAALSSRTIDPADYPTNVTVMPLAPSSSQAVPSSSQTATSAGTSRSRKRKADTSDPPSSSQTAASQVASSAIMPSQATELRRDEDIYDDDDIDADEVYVTMTSQVVGIQYYHGLVGSGEQVLLVREPNNKYDANAIQVLNIQRVQVGHIPRNVAGRLAPLMDQGLVTVEGTMIQGNLSGGRAFALSMKLQICGPADPVRRSRIEPYLVWATPGQRGFNQSQTGASAAGSPQTSKGMTEAQKVATQLSREKADELQRVLDGFKRVSDEGRRETLLDTLCAEQDILKIPEHPNPPSKSSGDLLTNLLKHQSQALKWCIDREHPEDHLPKMEGDQPVQFWQLRKTGNQTYWFNLATQTPQAEKPIVGKGGIMADAMGLGKTLTMLSLVLATQAEEVHGFSNATLVVVPLSVLSNWEGQIAEHFVPGKLSAHVYHGGGRNISAKQLAKLDVVITTYQTVVSEMDKPTGTSGPSKKKTKRTMPLFEVKWKRVILDEGHTVRSPRALMTQAVGALEADRRWIVTGTPIINSPNDLGSLLSFLRICRPLDQADFFKRLLVRPLTQGSPTAVDLLKALMNSICIRRTKEMQDEHGNPLVPLPPVEVVIVRVTLDDQTRKVYDAIEAESRRRFSEYLTGSNADPVAAPANVLSMLTRLRQLAIHPALVPPNYLEDLRAAWSASPSRSAKQLDPAEKDRLQIALARAIEDSEECPICYDNLKEPRILPCAHFFCLECISTIITRSPSALCPMDRGSITIGDLIEPKPLTEDISMGVDLDSNTSAPPSVKTVQLIKLLKLLPTGEKSLVFSQFTSYLEKIATALEDEGIPFVRFDGSMSAKRRQEVLTEFSKACPVDDDSSETEYEDEVPRKTRKGKGIFGRQGPQEPLVMLISLKAGALGLNLTIANNVFLMDPWWQESIESQAIDRVNRIGQKKNVTVYQLIADHTVESKVLEIQERKKKFIQQAFSGMKARENPRTKKEARMNELAELFGGRPRT